jgi:galactokinase
MITIFIRQKEKKYYYIKLNYRHELIRKLMSEEKGKKKDIIGSDHEKGANHQESWSNYLRATVASVVGSASRRNNPALIATS